MSETNRKFQPRHGLRKGTGTAIYVALLAAVLVGIMGLVVLLSQVLYQGVPWLSWHLLADYPSRHPEQALSLIHI